MMKKKNLVSLMVAAVFTVLSVTGLLIYFGQSNHTIDHTHAWFGMLFFTAAVFHIVNNWSSIKGYSTDRKTGGIKRELVVALAVVVLFAGGISADLPVFKDLANAGKKLFRPDRPEKRGMAKATIDSIARQMASAVMAVDEQTIKFDSTASLAENVIIAQGTASHAKPDTGTFRFTEVLTMDGKQWKVAAQQMAPLK
ncbi:DUF4405 domain-containing protein [uncultured Fibrella sp.]|uniref:DUF4405 domain-containing protein n=1 Tax=uncultured Fibrella sp. TaxID=1284596 RepID=UPI0035CAA7EF